jgi:hypothetical protein
MTRRVADASASTTSEVSNEPTVILESTFVPSGEVARREFPVENEPIAPGCEPDHWIELTVCDSGRLLLDIDALRAVWTGPGRWRGDDRS